MQSGEGFRAKLAKRYAGHTKIYTNEARGLLHHEPAMTDRESDLLSATVIPNEELLLAMMMYADQMEMKEAISSG